MPGTDITEDWTTLVDSVLHSSLDLDYLDEETGGTAYDDLLYWLSWLDCACAETDDQVYVFICEYTADMVTWNYLEWVYIDVHITQTQIINEAADTNLEYHGRQVVIRHDGHPPLVLDFRDDLDSEFSSVFTTSNLRVGSKNRI